MLCGRHLLVLCVSFGALTLSGRGAMAQTVVRPQASVLWVAAPDPPHTGGTRAARSAPARSALIGGLLGAAVGGIAGYAFCRRYSSTPGDPCTRTTLSWGALGGALGLLIGVAVGYDARRCDCALPR